MAEMECENEKGKRISVEQRELMLDFMLKHTALATGKFTAPDGAKHKQRLLNELTAALNSVANGVSKSADKWLKSWQDWRSDTKSKAALLKREMNKTGGGKVNPKAKPLSPLEERLLAFLGPNVVTGHEAIPDAILTVTTTTTTGGNFQEVVLSDDTSNDRFVMPFEGSVPSPFQAISHSSSPDLLYLTDESFSPAPSPAPSTSTPVVRSQCTSEKKGAKRKERCDPEKDEASQKLLKLTECQVDIAKETLELQRRQTSAMESSAQAFIGAMQALEGYFKGKSNNHQEGF